jgi:hypothetical protein
MAAKTKTWIVVISFFWVVLATPGVVSAYDPMDGIRDSITVGMAFMSNLALHESAHYVVANDAGALGNQIQFFSGTGGSFFLGLSTVNDIDNRAKLSYNLAGEVATSYTFEWALSHYRDNPTLYNKSLLFFSGTDFLWYSLYAFYLSPQNNQMFDPVGIANDTGLSHNAVFAIVFTQFALNALRVSTGRDDIVPYFTLDTYQAGFGIRYRF